MNKILTALNAALKVTNLFGSAVAPIDTLAGLPLGTVGGTATGELGVKVIVIAGGGGGGGGDASAANQTLEITALGLLNKGAPNFAIARGTANSGGTSTLATRATRREVTVATLQSSTVPVYVGSASGVNASTGLEVQPGQSISLDTTAALFFMSTGGVGTYQAVETYN